MKMDEVELEKLDQKSYEELCLRSTTWRIIVRLKTRISRIITKLIPELGLHNFEKLKNFIPVQRKKLQSFFASFIRTNYLS